MACARAFAGSYALARFSLQRVAMSSSRVVACTSALLLSILLAACASSGSGGGDDGLGPDGQPKPDPALCVGNGETGQPCTVTADCMNPLVCLGGSCVGPNDPSHTCDPVDRTECADPAETCTVTGACVIVPGQCMTTDQCPTGFVCADGACVPGHDGVACMDPGPGPNLTGRWAFHSNLELRKGMPQIASGLLQATELLRSLVEGTIDFGLPDWLAGILNLIIPQVIDQYVPEWAQKLVVALGNVSDVLDTMQVDSTVQLFGDTCDAAYRGKSKWDRIGFEYNGMTISKAPEEIAEIGPVTPEDFGAKFSCDRLYIDRHRINNTLSGLVRWVVNTVVEISTGYATVEEAISHAIDCERLAHDLNETFQRNTGSTTDITMTVQTACTRGVQGVVMQIDRLLDQAAITLGVVSLQGDALVNGDRSLGDGVWYGSVVGYDFPGSFTGEQR